MRIHALPSLVLLIASFGIVSGSLSAQTSDGASEGGGAMDMVMPTRATNPPQTPEQEEHGKQHGRTLPTPELLQPTLDPALQDFVPSLPKTFTGSLQGGSSDVTVVLMNKWIDAFRKFYPKADISIAPPYAGSLGAKELIGGRLQFVIVSRELKPDDITEFRAKFHYDPLSVPVCGGSYRQFGFLDAVVFFVNRNNPIDHLSFEQLDRLYSKTHHRGGAAPATWGDLGVTGEYASHPIHLYGIQPWNGFEEFVRQRALSTPGHRGEWLDTGIHFDKLVFPVAGRVEADPDGIGYAGLAFVDHPVKIIGISSDQGAPVYPTYTNVANATYPLSRLIYFNTNKAPDKPLDPLTNEFLRFVLSKQGQQVVLDEAIYIPLRGFQTDASRGLLGK